MSMHLLYNSTTNMGYHSFHRSCIAAYIPVGSLVHSFRIVTLTVPVGTFHAQPADDFIATPFPPPSLDQLTATIMPWANVLALMYGMASNVVRLPNYWPYWLPVALHLERKKSATDDSLESRYIHLLHAMCS